MNACACASALVRVGDALIPRQIPLPLFPPHPTPLLVPPHISIHKPPPTHIHTPLLRCVAHARPSPCAGSPRASPPGSGSGDKTKAAPTTSPSHTRLHLFSQLPTHATTHSLTHTHTHPFKHTQTQTHTSPAVWSTCSPFSVCIISTRESAWFRIRSPATWVCYVPSRLRGEDW